MKQVFTQIVDTLKASQNVLIISHNRPDGDTTGSNLALRLYLEKEGKNVVSACADELPDNLKFLPESDKFVTEFLLEDFDTVVIVDAGARHLVRFFEIYPELGRTKKPIISIDHHFSNDKFGTINAIDPEETSTTTLLYRFFTEQNIEITKDMATCLLNGIYTDTGSFMHGNTKSYTLKIASELLKLGGEFKQIADNNFKRTPVKKLKLMGEVLNNVQYDRIDQKIVGGVTNQTFEKFEATSEDLSGVVDFMTSIPDAKYTVLYTEDNKGGVKASLRTRRDDINVAEIAESFGGGGHSKAAGFKVPGKLEKQVSWNVHELESNNQ
jgi:phosphoesterase RecJ-like protein